MRFSVVIPAYKAQETLAKAIASVQRQTLACAEILVVSDDGADYRAVVGREGIHDPRLRFLSTGKVGSGEGNARNTGIAAATSRYIALLDADDCFTPHRLATIAPLVAQYGVVQTDLEVREFGTENTLPNINLRFDANHLSPAMLSLSGLHAFGHMAFDQQRCPVRFDVTRRLADVVFAFKFFDYVDRVGYSADPTYTYYRRPGSLCNEIGSAQAFLDVIADMLDPASESYAVISRYEKFGHLRRHLERIADAEKLFMQDAAQRSFQYHFAHVMYGAHAPA